MANDRKPKYKHSACVWTLGDGSSRFTGVSRPALTGADTVKKVKLILAGNTGVSGFEFHYPNEINEKNFKAIRTLLAGHGKETAMLTPNNHHHSTHRGLSSAHASERKAAIERAKRTIDLAYEMGTTVIVFWQGGEKYDDYSSIHFQDAIRHYADSVNQIIRYDKEQKGDRCVLAAEAKPNEPGRYMLFQTDSDYLAFRSLVAYPEKFKLNPETGHSELTGLDPVQSLAWIIACDGLAHYHINKQHGTKFDTDDQVDVDKTRLFIIRELIQSGYRGYVGHDIQPRHNYTAEDNVKVIRESVRNARTLEKLVSAINWKLLSRLEQEGEYLEAKVYLDKMLKRS
ncbi:MAG: TIM barrel protein [Planctomycetes bacterium]|nr:TIM barrel protein [Planctomycetota bacterium]